MRYKFARDCDGHWYLIPAELSAEFYKLLEDGQDDLWAEFNNKFEEYTSNNPCSYTFENPQ